MDAEALENDLRSVRELARATVVSHHVATLRFLRSTLAARGAPYLRPGETMALLDAGVHAAIAAYAADDDVGVPGDETREVPRVDAAIHGVEKDHARIAYWPSVFAAAFSNTK